MRNVWKCAGSAAVLCGLILMASPEGRAAVPGGLSVGGQDISGLKTEEAEQRIREYVASMAAQKVIIDVAGNPVETDAAALGLYWANDRAVAETVQEYETGNLIERYLKQKDLEMSPVDVELELKVPSGKAVEYAESACAGFAVEAVDAVITRENGSFVVTPSRDGTAVDAEATGEALCRAVEEAAKTGLKEPVTVAAVMKTVPPVRTTGMLSAIGDVLGTYSTDFSGSSQSRAENLRVGAGKINGFVLMPGETLSGYACMQPFTKANGYATAAAYENGQVVDSVGGGVCQIATTLYNAALLAELEITERQGHSMIVTYVPPSRDAAIAGTYKDIKITNPYDTPVYVEAQTSGRTLTFTIYGHETRPANRTVEYISETLGTTAPPAAVSQYDGSLAPGERVKVQASHTGRKSRLWKCVRVDGAEVERTLLHTDTYAPSPAVYRVGPEAAPASGNVPEETETAEYAAEPEETDAPEKSGTPEQTAEPEKAETPERADVPEKAGTPEQTAEPEKAETPERADAPEKAEMPAGTAGREKTGT